MHAANGARWRRARTHAPARASSKACGASASARSCSAELIDGSGRARAAAGAARGAGGGGAHHASRSASRCSRRYPTAGAAIVLVGAGGSARRPAARAARGLPQRQHAERELRDVAARARRSGELQNAAQPPADEADGRRHAAGAARARARAPRASRVIDTPSVSPADAARSVRLAQTARASSRRSGSSWRCPPRSARPPRRQLLEALAPLGANALAVTHADETDQIGVAVEAACRFGLAPEYMLDRGRSGALAPDVGSIRQPRGEVLP